MMDEFKLPSFQPPQKIIERMKFAKLYKENGNISKDVILMLDEMF